MKLISYRLFEMQIVEPTEPHFHHNMNFSHKMLLFVLCIIVFIAFLLINTPPTGSRSLLEQTEILVQPANVNHLNYIQSVRK